VAFHYVDLDRFKPVNDTYGHLLGDEVLRIVAERLRAATRQGDTVIRMGGDEFAVVQANVHDQASALVLADAIVETLGQPIIAHGRSVRVGASVGIALSAGGTASLRELSEAADRALYQAKALGGSRSLIAGSWDTSS
jgi:diguanylate cyclase (GGDEF)-like protein